MPEDKKEKQKEQCGWMTPAQNKHLTVLTDRMRYLEGKLAENKFKHVGVRNKVNQERKALAWATQELRCPDLPYFVKQWCQHKLRSWAAILLLLVIISGYVAYSVLS